MLSDERSDFDKFLTYYNGTINHQGLACWQQVQFQAILDMAKQSRVVGVETFVISWQMLIC